ncbi:unnamed protein product [Protopolystoma xenopodis]|uniref:Vacuolar protein sorting-associated protein 33A n=1 Tax=Protopolystoma xenopodis TaxID=117903 RepID=A0A3S5C3H3_9PLAT|nr:unnamed protein product [Protopolystoma xenopodis]
MALDSYQSELLTILDSKPNPKALYWDNDLMTPVNLIISYSLLQEHGVSNTYVIKTSNNVIPPPNVKSVIFIVRPDLKLVDSIQSFVVQETTGKSNSREYHIIAIPRFSLVCRNYLKEKKSITRFLSIIDFPLTLLPIDTDVISMENPLSFSNLCLRDGQNDLVYFALGLIKFQTIYGSFSHIRAKGDKAKVKKRTNSDCPGRVELLVILDRVMDPLTPLLRQLTYEGLISERFGIKYGFTRIHKNPKSSGDELRRINLNSNDELYTELRDKNFSSVGAILNLRSREISAIVNETRSAKNLEEIRKVVNQLPEIREAREALETLENDLVT